MASKREYRGGYYKMDHVSFGKMMRSEQCRPALAAVAQQIALAAKARTERNNVHSFKEGADEGYKSLADSYEVETGPVMVILDQGLPGPRITQRVVNRLRHAAVIEFGVGGWKRGKGERNLRKAGEMYGNLAREIG